MSSTPFTINTPVAFLISLLVSLCACVTASAPSGAAATPASSVVLARGKGFEITDAFFTARWTEQCVKGSPAPRTPSACLPENRRVLLDNMVRFKLLAAEARRKGVQNEPDVAYDIEKVLVQKLVRMEIPSTSSREESLAAFDALVDGLQARAGVEIDTAKLDALPLPVLPRTQQQEAPSKSP